MLCHKASIRIEKLIRELPVTTKDKKIRKKEQATPIRHGAEAGA
jgi:hypothetical protein